MIYTDIRGELHSLKSIPFIPKETLISVNEKNVFRGLHLSPYAKYIYILDGNICDIYINFETKEFNKVTLKKGESLYIPSNYAHGFYCNEKSTLLYFLEDNYNVLYDKKIYYMTPEIIHMGIEYDFPISGLIMSKEDLNAKYYKSYEYLILGSTGYLGSNLIKYLENYMIIDNRLSDINGIKTHINKSDCKYVICAAGISGRPTIEWCETHEKETFETNYLDMIKLIQICDEYKKHLTIFGSGLVYNNDKTLYTENDIPNLTNKVYTKYRVALENIIRSNIYQNVLYLRIMYPCTFDEHEKCFFTKMKNRALNGYVHNVEVPLTIVPDLFPKIHSIINTNTIGILNFVNKGIISLPKLLTIRNIDCQNIKEPDINAIGINFTLCSKKLENIIENINNVEELVSIDYSNI